MTTHTLDGPAPAALVGVDWLRRRLTDPRLRLVDLRDSEAFAVARVPGAVRLELADLGSERDGCENVLLGPADFQRLMADLGIGSDDTVVAYDDQWGLAAARLLWALHAYGHRAVHVLNGGWAAWTEEGGAIESGEREPPRTATASPGRPFRLDVSPEVIADREWISAAAGRSDVALLDTRTPAEFDAGHIPGAVCWDWFEAVPPGGWTASREPVALRDAWAALGVEPTDEVVVYCRSGMRAAHTYMVLRHAGFTRVRLYDGSWQEWSALGGAG